MELDGRVLRRYELDDEDARLLRPGRGDLIRLRTWDILGRHLPAGAIVADVGGGPGVHASFLAAAGHQVTLVDPVPRHVEQATARAGSGPAFTSLHGDARDVPLDDSAFDAVLLMGPLYHLTDPADRALALAEAARVLRPGGKLIAETITRHAYLLDATIREHLDTPGIWDDFSYNIGSGLSHDPDDVREGAFWAYHHHLDEIVPELTQAGFCQVELVAVEGFAWLLGDLEARMSDPGLLLHAVRLTETEPSMLGVTAHVIAVATCNG